MIYLDGKKLDKIIKEKGIPKSVIAEGIGVHRTSLNNWISGRVHPERTVIIKLADFLKIETSEFSNIKIGSSINLNSILSTESLIKDRNRRKYELMERFKQDDLIIEQLNQTIRCITSSINQAFYVKSVNLRYICK